MRVLLTSPSTRTKLLTSLLHRARNLVLNSAYKTVKDCENAYSFHLTCEEGLSSMRVLLTSPSTRTKLLTPLLQCSRNLVLYNAYKTVKG